MRVHIFTVTLLSAALLSSCSPLHPDVRPEVSQPLNEAVHLSGYFTPNRAAIMAKLNQAASVPNLNSDEQDKIRATAAIALAKVPNGPVWDYTGGRDYFPSTGPDYAQHLGFTVRRDGN